MTCIAANLSQMACDSMMSNGFVDFPSPKIRAYRGSLFGGAGEVESLALFWQWLFGGRKKKPFSPEDAKDIGDFEVMELSPQGLFLWGAQLIPVPVSRQIHAIGAGGQAAVTAMLLGKTPTEACEIACGVAPSACARPIRTYDLIDAQKEVKRRRRAR